MTLKQFTTIDGNKIIVNMERVEYIDNDCLDGCICLNTMGNVGICVKGTLKSIMRWYRKQNQEKKAKTIEIPRAIITLLTNDDLVHNKDNQTPDFSKSDFYYKEGQLPNSSGDDFWTQPPKITC